MYKLVYLPFLMALSMLYACADSAAIPSSVEASSHFNNAWAMDSLWDTGLAEVAVYDAQRVVYGKTRHFDYTYILVKETFNEAYQVKTDDYERKDLFDVMKINKFARIATDNYPYHYLTSIFYRREQPSTVYKLTNNSEEWCGNTSKYFLSKGRNYQFGYNSYWDGQGIGEKDITGGFMFEDQLSHSLRALKFEEGLSFQQKLAETQITNKASEPFVYEATFTVNEEKNLRLNTAYSLEEVKKVWKVTVQLDKDKTNEYWFAGEYPNILLRQITWDGTNLRLQEAYMDDYWKM